MITSGSYININGTLSTTIYYQKKVVFGVLYMVIFNYSRPKSDDREMVTGSEVLLWRMVILVGY